MSTDSSKPQAAQIMAALAALGERLAMYDHRMLELEEMAGALPHRLLGTEFAPPQGPTPVSEVPCPAGLLSAAGQGILERAAALDDLNERLASTITRLRGCYVETFGSEDLKPGDVYERPEEEPESP